MKHNFPCKWTRVNNSLQKKIWKFKDPRSKETKDPGNLRIQDPIIKIQTKLLNPGAGIMLTLCGLPAPVMQTGETSLPMAGFDGWNPIGNPIKMDDLGMIYGWKYWKIWKSTGKAKKMTLFEALAPGRLLMARRSADGGLRLADGRRRPLDVWDAKKGRLLHEFYEFYEYRL